MDDCFELDSVVFRKQLTVEYGGLFMIIEVCMAVWSKWLFKIMEMCAWLNYCE